MKRFLSLFLAFIFVIGVFFSTPVIASAEDGSTEVVEEQTGEASGETTETDPYSDVPVNDFSTDGFIKNGNWIYYKNPDNTENVETVTIKGFYSKDKPEKVTIPDRTVNLAGTDYNIVGIGANAFEYCDSLEQITIPTTIKAIDEKAFTGCDSLQRIVYKGHLEDWEVAFKGTLGENVLSTTVCQDATISYVGNENTITATCGACQKKCGTLTLDTTPIEYDGSKKDIVKVAGTVPGYTKDMEPSYSADPIDAGEYTATFELKINDEVKASAEANFIITPKPIKVTLETIDFTYDGNEHKPIENFTDTAEENSKEVNLNEGENEDYTLVYKRKGTVTTDLTSIGEIEVSVILKNGGNYTFGTLENASQNYEETLSYSIKYLEVSEDAYTISEPVCENGNVKWYKDSVTVTPAENYKISTLLTGNYDYDSITISGTERKFYLKNEAGQMTDAIALPENIKFDNTAPEVTFKIGETDLTEDVYSATEVKVSVVTNDADSGVKEDSVKYFIGDNTTVVENIDVWTKVEGPITVKFGGSKKVFVKVSDNVGNETIVSSPAIIEPATLTANDFKFNKPESWTYGDTDKSISITPKEGVNVSTENISVKYYSVVDGKETEVGAPINAGTYKVKIDVKNETQYKNIENLTCEDWTFEIAKADVTLELPTEVTDLIYTGGPQDLINAGSTDDGTIYYTLNPSDDSSWKETIPTGIDAKTYKVYYKVIGDDNHNDIAHLESNCVEVTINKKVVSTISFKGIDPQIYTGLQIIPSNVKIIISENGQPKVLANTEYTLTYGENVNVGTGTVTVTLNDNYCGDNSSIATATTTFDITKAQSEVAISAKENLVYTGEAQALLTEAAEATFGVVEYSITDDINEGEWVSSIPEVTLAGKYILQYKVTGNDNYEGVTGSLEITIAPKPITVALAQTSGTYNGKPHTTDVKFNDVVTTDKFELDTDFSVEYYRDDMTTETDDFTSVGEIKAVVTLKNTNYTFADGKTSVTLPYTIKEHIHNWKYEASGAVITATCQNDGCEIKSTTVTLKAPENLVYDGTAKSVIVDAPHADLLDKYTLKNSEGTDAGTYTAILTIADKTAILEFEITKAVITVTKVSAIDRVYDGKLAVAINKTDAIAYTGLIDGDKVGFDLSALTGTLSDANVGSNKSVKVSGSIVLTGEDAKNYMVSTPAETIVNITPATLTITPDAKTSEQYYKLPGLTYKVTGLIGTDTLTKAPALTTNADIKKTGDYTITATGAEASANYKITYAAGKMTITEHKNHIVATDGWKATVPGTCMVAGKEAGTCTLCSGTVTRDSKIDPNNHKLITTVTKKATCTQDGEALVTCANGCKYSLKTALPADGKSHTFATEFTVNNSTCVAKGSKYKPCQNPGCSVKSEYAEIPVNPDAHTKTEIINVKAENCTEEGYTGDTYCPDCKKVVKPGVEIPAKGHTEGDWIVDKPASFTEEGSQHKECTVCKTELKKEVIAKLALDTPVVKIANDGKGIKVSWSQDTDATGYTVYRSEYNPTTKKWTKWKNRGTAAATKKSWVDKTVKEGVTYKFTVRGVNGDNKSAYKETNGLLYVVAPKVKVSISSTGLLANWNKINNASGYIVYRATLGADGKWAKWVKLGTTAPEKNTWYDGKAVSGVTYRYTVRAVVNNVQSGFTASASVVYLAQPLLKISNTSTGVTGKWESIAGATGYIIYRSEYNTSTKKWTKWLNLGTTKATAKKFTDKTAKSGYTYKYTIRAINGKFKSTYQDSNKLIFLAQPTLKVSNVANGVQGKWNQVSGATGYIIYRSELKDGKWTGWTSLGTAKATAKSFTDKTVKSGVTYKYTIRAKNGAYKSSYVATGAVVFLSVPTVKISSGITGVNVSWSKITGATSYLVYRREVVNGKWSKWAELKTVTENSLVDETAKSGTQYRYTVRALNGKSRSMYTSTKTLHYLVAPTVTVEKAADGVKVNWTQSAGATGYIVYRAELGADGKWSKWVALGNPTASHSSCKDKTVKADVTYKYTVRAVNGKVKSAYIDNVQIVNKAQ